MASSSEVRQEIDQILGELNPMLDSMPGAEDYYKKKANEAYDYNMPALKTGADMEKKLYTLPGQLMGQYDQEFGGKTGVSSMQRMNSILGQLGNQAGVANTAWGAADQAGARIDDIAKSLYNQYMSKIEAKQAQLNPLMAMWDRMFAEENANARAARSGGGGYGGSSLGEMEALLMEEMKRRELEKKIKKNEEWNAKANEAWNNQGNSNNTPLTTDYSSNSAPNPVGNYLDPSRWNRNNTTSRPKGNAGNYLDATRWQR